MSAILLLSSEPWVEHLGWTLLHFLWQGVLIAGVYAIGRKWTSRPQVRYGLACAALALMAAAPVLTWSLLGPSTMVAPAPVRAVPLTAAASNTSGATSTFFAGGIEHAAPALMPWVVAVWLAGAVAFWLRMVGGWVIAVRLRSRMVRPAPPEWQQSLERLKVRMRLSRPVRLLVSGLVAAPAVVGWLRPVVLVPLGALAGLPADQMEGLLLHELAHIRRHDYLVNMLQGAVEALLFYHPAVWWVSGHMRTERELCCDDAAVSVHGDALTYVRALAELESARPEHLAVLAASGGSLAHRVARLLGQSRPASGALSGPGVLAAAALAAITAFGVFGQPAARPKFDVASVKPSAQRNFQMVRPLPGGLSADASLRMLMQNAYSIQAFQIVGGPAWMDSERFAIDAKAGASATRAEVFLMLQSLLEERFQLQIHREVKEMPAYALLPAKSGIKLAAPKEGSCVDPDSAAPPWAGGRIAPPGTGPAPMARCGILGIGLQATGARVQGGKIAMTELIRTLSMLLDSPVIDGTGFSGLFDVRLDFLPDEITAALPPPPPPSEPGAASLDGKSPSILSALQEQLGLRLERTKGPADVVVVDRVEHPSGN